MPFYEYECPGCRYYTEVMQKISDKSLKKCPSCGKSGFKRLISAPVFRLKGSGWYETDFKSDKEGKRNLVGEREEAKPAEAAKAADTAKPDSKDTATEAKPTASKTEAVAGKGESAATATKPAPGTGRRRHSSAPARTTARKRAVARKAK